jgi:hypothetical protein
MLAKMHDPRKLLLSTVLLLLTCSLARASEPEPTSPEPSLLHLTEAEIVSILGPEESYSVPEIATIVLELQAEAREEIRLSAEEAAAKAVAPVLVDLAGITAERDSALGKAEAWGIGLAIGVPAAGILGALLGWGLRALLHPG